MTNNTPLIILFLLLVLFLVFWIKLRKLDLLSPTFLLSAAFSVSTFIAILGNQTWGVSISYKTLFVLLFGIITFSLGEVFVNKKLKVQRKISLSKISFRLPTILFIIIISFVSFFIVMTRVYDIALETGYSGGSNILLFVRNGILIEGKSLGFLNTIALFFVYGSGCFLLFVYLNNFFKESKKLLFCLTNFFLIIPFVLSLILQYFLASRSTLIYSGIYSIALFLLLNKFNNNYFRPKTLIVLSVTTVFLILVSFVVAGFSLGKMSAKSVLDTIYVYGGSAIIGFNNYIKNPYFNFGSINESFFGIRALINRFLPSFGSGIEFNVFINFGVYNTTNIYTSFKSYISDFGLIGLFVLEFILGASLTYMYRNILRNKWTTFLILIYPAFVYYNFNQIFAPSITSNLFTVTQLFNFIYLFLFYCLFLLSPKKIKRLFVSDENL